MKQGFVKVTGGNVWYQIHNEDATEIPIIILHGGPGSSSYSLQGLHRLATKHPVILYDQLGCGRSDRPDDPTLWRIERFVEELHQLLNHLKLKRVHLLGHSWGTTLAAAFYFTYPASVKSIAFSSSCLSAPLWEKDQKRNIKKLAKETQTVIHQCEASGNTDTAEFQKAINEFNKQFVCRIDPYPAFLLEGKSYRNPTVYQIMWGPSEFSVKGNLKSFDCTPQLHTITCPVLYTCGRFDEATPETTEFYCSLTPNATFHVFEASAHMPYIEEPEEYIRVMSDFFQHV